jgi:outer membrane protein, multidrug efflux system
VNLKITKSRFTPLQHWGCWVLCALGLVGCTTSPTQPEAITPKQATTILLPEGYLNQTVAASSPTPQIWWKALNNEELNQLVDRALANSPDLRIATVQMVEAKIRADQVTAGGSPTLTAPIASAIQAPGGTVGNVPVGTSNRDPQRTIQTSLAGRWRLDVWGERKSMQDSADLLFWRSVYERENAQRILISTLTNSYISYLAANDTLRLARDEEVLAKELVKTLEQRFALRDVTIDQLEQGRAMLYVLQAAIPSYEQQKEEAKTNIAFLIGAVPQQLSLIDRGLDAITAPPIPSSLPSSLLAERPDIRLMEARLKSAHADIDVARSRLLPPIDLSSQAGFSGLGPSQLLQSQFFFWNAIASITATIFDGNAKELDKAASQVFYQEMVETYARTVLQSVKEVESALTSMRVGQAKLNAQGEVVRVGFNLNKTSQQAYAVGAVDLSAILEAQKTYRRELLDQQQLKSELLKAYVNLYQALGAGVVKGLGENLKQIGTEPEAIIYTNPEKSNRSTGLNNEGVTAKSSAVSAKEWEVEIYSVFDRSVLPALWRDLNRRYALHMQSRSLRAYLGDKVQGEHGELTAWYRVSVVGFKSLEEAKQLCDAMQSQQQACSVAEAGAGKFKPNVASSSSWWLWP